MANALIYKLIIHASAKLVLPVDIAKQISMNAKVSHAWITRLVSMMLMDITVSALKISPVYFVKRILTNVLANPVSITAIVLTKSMATTANANLVLMVFIANYKSTNASRIHVFIMPHVTIPLMAINVYAGKLK